MINKNDTAELFKRFGALNYSLEKCLTFFDNDEKEYIKNAWQDENSTIKKAYKIGRNENTLTIDEALNEDKKHGNKTALQMSKTNEREELIRQLEKELFGLWQ